MQDAQTEEFVIYGIQSDYAAMGHIKYEDLKLLISDSLQMQPIFELIIKILEDVHGITIVDKIKLDIQTIFKCFNNLTFLREVPKFLNGRLTTQNISIIKAAIHLLHDELLTVKDIKNACLIFHLREQELMTEGVPLDPSQINNMLWAINKAVSARVLDEWIKRCADFVQIKGYIQAFEFLYLMANTVDRWAYFNKYPKTGLDLSRDPKYNIHNVDTTGFKTIKNPDAKIQHFMNYQFNLEKATFKGRSLNDRNEHFQQKRNQKFQQFLSKKDTTIGEFKKILRDPELYVEIRQRLKNAQQIINHSKLNGKMLRVQLLEQLAGVKDPISNLKEHPQYQKITPPRPMSSSLQAIKEDVDTHKKMMQDTAFVTEYIQRATSAGSMGTTKASFRRPMTAEKGRPMTASVVSSQKFLTGRPLTGMTEVKSQMLKVPRDLEGQSYSINQILDEELSIFESRPDEAPKQTKLVFYGSANSIKRSHNINTPWQQQKLKLF